MKKNLITTIVSSGALLLAMSCSNSNSNQNAVSSLQTPENTEISLFPRGEKNSTDYFSGEAYLHVLVNPEQTDGYYSAGSVTFQPGARTNWHTHPSVQTLIITEGNGWYQERGKEAIKIEKGSVIPIPIGIEHWHGATRDSKLVHIAITNVKNNSAVTWLTPVTDDEYNSVQQ